jgi:hypothetical protein
MLTAEQRRLLNLLSPCNAEPPPDPAERTAWLECFLPEIEAKAEAELPDSATNHEIDKHVVSAVTVRWRYYLHRTGRDFRADRRPSPYETLLAADIARRAEEMDRQPPPPLPGWVALKRF